MIARPPPEPDRTVGGDCRPGRAIREKVETDLISNQTPPEEIDRAKACGFVHGITLYPAGATTHSVKSFMISRAVAASP